MRYKEGMDVQRPGPVGPIVVMGVSGSGKSTVGRALAAALGRRFIDADDHHPAANVAKMASGRPLDDADRWPWLDRLNGLLRQMGEARPGAAMRADVDEEELDAGAAALPGAGAGAGAIPGGVLACSALKRAYRLRLGAGVEGLVWVYLRVDRATLRRRMEGRAHFMPAALLDSQLTTLEEPTAEEAVVVDADRPVDQVMAAVVARL